MEDLNTLLTLIITGLTLLGGLITFGPKESMLSAGIFLHRWGLYTILPVSIFLLLKKNYTKIIIASMILLAIISTIFSFLNILPIGFETRAHTFGIGPNKLAQVYYFVWLTSIVSFFNDSNQLIRSRAFLFFAIIASICGLFLAASRGALIAAIFGTVYIVVKQHSLRSHFRFVKFSLSILIFILVITFFYSGPLPLFERISEIRLLSNERLGFLFIGFEAFLKHPLGIGTIELSPQIARPIIFSVMKHVELASTYGIKDFDRLIFPHMQYMEWLIEGGVLALLLYLLLIIKIWNITALPDQMRILLRSIVLALLVHGLFDRSFGNPISALLLWLLLAIAFDESIVENKV